jgi:hypothetical protein
MKSGLLQTQDDKQVIYERVDFANEYRVMYLLPCNHFKKTMNRAKEFNHEEICEEFKLSLGYFRKFKNKC